MKTRLKRVSIDLLTEARDRFGTNTHLLQDG